jgi:hypothetical protein
MNRFLVEMVCLVALFTRGFAAETENWKPLIVDTFKLRNPDREADGLLNGTKSEEGDSIWRASEGIVFGKKGEIIGNQQQNMWAKIPLNLKGAPDKTSLEIFAKVRLGGLSGSNSFWLGFQGDYTGLFHINPKKRTWYLTRGGPESVFKEGKFNFKGDKEYEITLRYCPKDGAYDVLIDGKMIVEKEIVPDKPEKPVLPKNACLRFYFLGNFVLREVRISTD